MGANDATVRVEPDRAGFNFAFDDDKRIHAA
jgi:hypothetical protein